LTCVIVNSRRKALHQGTPEVHKGSPLGQNPCGDWALERERKQESEQNLKDQGQASGLMLPLLAMKKAPPLAGLGSPSGGIS
jgi:hypothetical protein